MVAFELGRTMLPEHEDYDRIRQVLTDTCNSIETLFQVEYCDWVIAPLGLGPRWVRFEFKAAANAEPETLVDQGRGNSTSDGWMDFPDAWKYRSTQSLVDQDEPVASLDIPITNELEKGLKKLFKKQLDIKANNFVVARRLTDNTLHICADVIDKKKVKQDG